MQAASYQTTAFALHDRKRERRQGREGENMPKLFRRIVTTKHANGKLEVLFDGPATNELATIMSEMWVTGAGFDHAVSSKSLEPPAGTPRSAAFGAANVSFPGDDRVAGR
jgi:hypothetical protein